MEKKAAITARLSRVIVNNSEYSLKDELCVVCLFIDNYQ